VRVPAEAANGKAKITLSFANWKDGNVAPTTVEVPIVDAKTDKREWWNGRRRRTAQWAPKSGDVATIDRGHAWIRFSAEGRGSANQSLQMERGKLGCEVGKNPNHGLQRTLGALRHPRVNGTLAPNAAELLRSRTEAG
jgi:hypothetical protein